MKRTFFIVSGTIVLILIFSVWVFLLLFGTPNNIENAFTNLGLGGNPTPIEQNTESILEQTSQLDINSNSLVQLTIRPVAGYGFLSNGTTTARLLYAERGTGHIYEIDLTNGIESRIAAKTFLAVTDAIFSPNGGFVVIVSETEDGTTAVLENLSGGPDYEIPTNASNFKFINDSELRYTTTSASGTAGYSFDLIELTIDQLFSVPLSDIFTIWGSSDTLVISKPAPRLRGTLLRVENDQLARVGSSEYNLSAIVPKEKSSEYIISKIDTVQTGQLVSGVFNELSGEFKKLPLLAWPEKCAVDHAAPNILWCATSAPALGRDSQSDWYKGKISFADSLWRFDTVSLRGTLVESLTETSGRNIDAVNVAIDQNSKFLLFKNKIDNSLWLKKLQ